MDLGLNPPKTATLDFLSLGALNHRVDSGIIPFRKATQWTVHPSGGEYNVAANLSNCFRLRTGMVSAMVEYPIGDLIAERVRLIWLTDIAEVAARPELDWGRVRAICRREGNGRGG